MKKRDKNIDVLRGIGILLMVLGHLDVFYEIKHYIYAFHMPLFFFISGLFADSLCKKSFTRMLLEKTKTLLVPYFGFGLGHYAIWYMMGQNGADKKRLLSNLFWMTTNELAITGAIWFLMALFWTSILYWLIAKWIHNECIKLFICAVIAIVGMSLPSFFSVRLPLALDNAMVGLLFFEVAHLLIAGRSDKNKIAKLLELKKWMIFSGMVLHVFLCLYNENVIVSSGIYGNMVFFLINAIIGCILYYNFARAITPKIQERRMGKPIYTVLEQIGEKSIVYVCLNQLYIIVIQKLIHMLFLELDVSVCFLKQAELTGTFIFSVLALYITARLFYYKPLCYLIGKGPKINST